MGIVKEEDTKAGTVNAIQLFAARRRRRKSRRLNQQRLSAAATQLNHFIFILHYLHLSYFQIQKFNNRQRAPALATICSGETGVVIARNMNHGKMIDK